MLISPIPTEPWRAPDRERRRRICRRIRRTFLRTIGCATVALVIGYAAWFRFGWTDLPLRCVDWDYGETRQIAGELRPEAADALERWLARLYGEAAVKQVAPGRLRVRPVVVYFGDHSRLRSLTIQLTDRFSDLPNYPATGPGTTDDCRIVQHYLMVGGRAASCDDSWDQFFMEEINQDVWPAMTHFFRVNQPDPGHMFDLPMFPLLHFPEDLPDGAAPEDIAELDCDAPMGEKFIYGTFIAGGAVIGFFVSLWPF